MGPGDPENILTVLAYPFFLGGYVLAGWVLRAYVYEHFDEVAGRARRSPRPFQSRQEPASEGEIQFVDEE